MKKTFLAATLLALTLPGFSQTGKVKDNLTMDSEILEMERNYAIFLPADDETSERSYPVLYLLHGGGDDPHAERYPRC